MDNFEFLEQQIIDLKKSTDYFVYGNSYLKQDLIAFHKGSYLGKQLLITGGMHSREYISCLNVINIIKNYNSSFGCYFVPITNPDGVKIALNGISWIDDDSLKKILIRLNEYSTNFSLWKANARGVDLNVNYDAMWGKNIFAKNYPCFSGYAGECPNSEVENSSLINFIKNKNICFSLAYHSKGEVVYYGFEYLSKIKLKEIKKYAKQISKNLNYKLIRSCGSTGGLTDFLAYKYNINAVTIELGKDCYSHPIKFEKINEVFSPQMSMINNLILSIKNNTKI